MFSAIALNLPVGRIPDLAAGRILAAHRTSGGAP